MRHIFFRGLLYISKVFKLYYLVPNLRLISLKLKFLLLKALTLFSTFITGLCKDIKGLKSHKSIELDLPSNLI